MSSSSSKKRKVEDENRLFQEKWKNAYFVTNVRDKTCSKSSEPYCKTVTVTML